MTEHPQKLADHPELRRLEDPRADVLADMLSVTLLRSALYKRVEARAPWGLQVGYPEHAVFYLVVHGSAWLDVIGGAPLRLSAGDAALLPHGTRHVLRDALTTQAIEAHDGHQCLAPGQRSLGAEGGAVSALLAGFFALEAGRAPSLLAGLPAVVPLRQEDGLMTPWVAASLQLLLAEASQPGPASALILQRLADVLLIQSLRALTARAHPSGECQHAGLAALADEPMRQALGLMHEQLAHPWTLGELATRVGLSRSLFAARFTALVGEPAMTYLARWRMTRAAELLRDTTLSLDEVAERVGYESVPAFSRAFVRHRGARPGAYRRDAQAPTTRPLGDA